MKIQTERRPTPDLGDDQIIRAVCGLRPCRRGGLRLEIEPLGPKTIVHNYGHGGCGVTISFGTAEIASDLVDKVASPKGHIAVLGGGVVGLTTANELLNRGYQVVMYADRIAHETTSLLAGALWLPVGVEFGHSPSHLQRRARILSRSRTIFRSIDRDRFGIEALPIYEPEGSHTEPGLFDDGLIDPPIEIDSFPFKCAAKPGRMFSTDFIHTHQFLSALKDDFVSLGGETQKRLIKEREDLLDLDESVVVNCTALGSNKLFDDQQMFPARGVLVHMKPQALGYCIHDGYKYMFPRKDALILGGCFQEDRWDDEPDQSMIDEIINHHRRFFGQI